MSKKAIAFLKSVFTTGARPTAQDFADVFDSFVHKDDAAAVSESAIDQKITTYDTNLRAQSSDGVVNTLGDLFKVFQGWSDTQKLTDKLTWSAIPSKPNQLSLAWTEQQILFSSVTWGTTSGAAVRSIRGLATSLTSSDQIVIIDMTFLAHELTTSQGPGVKIYSPVAVTIAINPKANT